MTTHLPRVTLCPTGHFIHMRHALILQRQFVMSMFVVAGAGSGLAGAAPVRPVPDVDEGVLDWAGDAVEQSPDLVDCQRY
ncbi:hypothetical protein RHA1_ro01668 [Rhodococcus jostii RHA1]|uniref:Uncharacterized protein n=1 Tax=Rhodococcus jostii (strain RHA1) TaxID=101510 RepID=Q0SG55_RHOJR|nr:hypothetical protein RHA1_ro01668 [Rhodococcus jostii RHA1]